MSLDPNVLEFQERPSCNPIVSRNPNRHKAAVDPEPFLGELLIQHFNILKPGAGVAAGRSGLL